MSSRAILSAISALRILAQEHARDSLHVYDDRLHYGINCSVCSALMELDDFIKEQRNG